MTVTVCACPAAVNASEPGDACGTATGDTVGAGLGVGALLLIA